MPAFNAERFLVAAVESILGQAFRDFEFRIFDDGSTDRTLETLCRLASKDARIVVQSARHQGYTPLLNKGVSQSRGEFIARMDADDIAMPDRFARQIEYLQKHPECVAVGSSIQLIDEDGDPFTIQHCPTTHEEIDAAHLRGGGGTMPHPSLMMRTEAIRRVGGYHTEYEPAEDLDLLLRLAEIGRLANLGEPLLKYRVHAQMVSTVRAAKQAAEVKRILAATWQRRELPGEPPMPGTPAEESNGKMARRWCLKAFHAGYYDTALKYARRNLRSNLLSAKSWRLWARMAYVRLRNPQRR